MDLVLLGVARKDSALSGVNRGVSIFGFIPPQRPVNSLCFAIKTLFVI